MQPRPLDGRCFDEQDKVYEVRLIDKPNYNMSLQKVQQTFQERKTYAM